jgi:hypothetical protein
MPTYLMHASMLDDASTDEQRDALREQLGDARIRHNPTVGVLIARFPIQGEDRRRRAWRARKLLRSALCASRISPIIVTLGPAAAEAPRRSTAGSTRWTRRDSFGHRQAPSWSRRSV